MICLALQVSLSKLLVPFGQKGGGTGKKGLASQLSLDYRARRSG
ncbi:Uncharacterised protein [Streptococcus cristatus]|nr:Uncharacterised protein [Streptococcus cristatus]